MTEQERALGAPAAGSVCEICGREKNLRPFYASDHFVCGDEEGCYLLGYERLKEERGTLLWAVRQAVAGLTRAAGALRARGAFMLEAQAARDTLAWLDGHDGLQIALRAAGRMDEPQASAAQPPLKAVSCGLEGCIILDSHGHGTPPSDSKG